MKWYHEVKREWLAERKGFLTASDIGKLVPTTPTGRSRLNMEKAYLKVWAEKQCSITEDDLCSSGVMARGHLLEPYALAEFNKLKAIPTLYHWDDALVYSTDNVSCSPDALDVAQPSGSQIMFEEFRAQHLGEVKAYNGALHYQVGFGDKMTIEERWQIATGFYTMPTLEVAALIMFNPTARHPVLYHLYERAELNDELDAIKQVVDEYYTASVKFESGLASVCPASVKIGCVTEEEIIEELLAKADIDHGINP